MARPKEFDPQEALDKAMHQFWAKGYHDTSIRDLVERTGVNYYGLYSEFDSKHGLFLAALDHYRDTVTAMFVRALQQDGPVSQVLKEAFERLLARTRTEDGHVGCLMCNTAIEVAPYDKAVAEKVRANTAHLRDVFHARLAKGQREGELDQGSDLDGLAEFLATTAYTVGFLSRAGREREDTEAHHQSVRRHIEIALKAVV